MFDDENPAVIGLQAEAISTYYGGACVDVAGGYDGIVIVRELSLRG